MRELAWLVVVVALAAQEPLPGLYGYNEAKEACAAKGERLPEAGELYGLFDPQEIGEGTLYWSATAVSETPTAALAVAYKAGEIMPRAKGDKLSVLCSAAPRPQRVSGRFVREVAGVRDHEWGVLWEIKSTQSRRLRYAHEAAKGYCASLGEGWRLPTVGELYSLVDHVQFSPATDKGFFGETVPRYYWSATAAGAFDNEAFVVGFKIGSVAASSKENESFVRCVRSMR